MQKMLLSLVFCPVLFLCAPYRTVAKMWSKTTSLCTEDAAPVLGKDILLIVSHPQGSSGQERKGAVST